MRLLPLPGSETVGVRDSCDQTLEYSLSEKRNRYEIDVDSTRCWKMSELVMYASTDDHTHISDRDAIGK